MSTIINKDIFYGLPKFPCATRTKYTAIVTGANGITGQHILRALSESPERWKTIHALNRTPPQNALSTGIVKYLSVDFLRLPGEIVKMLDEIHHMRVASPYPTVCKFGRSLISSSDYIFLLHIFSLLKRNGLWSHVEEKTRVNGRYLDLSSVMYFRNMAKTRLYVC
jgi:hypothetical protein